MRRRPRQISLKECYDILKLEKDADMADIKRAYRRRAFELHPDLNPDNPDASREFQLLNEAYVALSAVLKHEEGVRAAKTRRGAAGANATAEKAAGPSATEKTAEEKPRKETSGASKANQRGAEATTGQDTTGGATAADAGETTSAGASSANQAAGSAGEKQERNAPPGAAEAKSGDKTTQDAYSEQDVLRDLLNDPFARRVFEDIYSQLNKQQQEDTAAEAEAAAQEQPKAKPTAEEKRNVRLHKSNLAWGTPKWGRADAKGVTGLVKGWLRRQIDEEQSLALPAANLLPGKRVRLQIRQAFSGELKTVDITLPPDFTVGRPIRLRGLGKRVGPWQGDLYLILTNE